MSMNPALAMIFTGVVPGPVKGVGTVLTGAEGFADVMTGIETLPGEPTEGVATGANLRFNVAAVAPPAEGLSGAALAEAPAIEPGTALPLTVDGRPMAKPVLRTATTKNNGPVPVGLAAIAGEVLPDVGESITKALGTDMTDPALPRERETNDDASLEMATAVPAGTLNTPAAISPEAPKIRSEKKPSGTISHIAVARDGQAGGPDEKGVQGSRMAVNPASGDSRKGADPAPVSLTAVTDIIQNLPPLVQNQIGPAIQAGPSAAIGAPADVGATLSGQVIDMGVGGQWIDRVAREIAALAEGSGHSRFQLSPPNLGRLQIDVWQGEGGGRVQLLTETDEAATRLRQDQASLHADARLSALSLDRIVIDRAPGGFGPSQDQNSQPGAGRQHNGGDPANQPGGQAGQQTAAQGNGGSAAGQGKAPHRRDVFNDHTQPDAQDGQPSGRADDRHVRYA